MHGCAPTSPTRAWSRCAADALAHLCPRDSMHACLLLSPLVCLQPSCKAARPCLGHESACALAGVVALACLPPSNEHARWPVFPLARTGWCMHVSPQKFSTVRAQFGRCVSSRALICGYLSVYALEHSVAHACLCAGNELPVQAQLTNLESSTHRAAKHKGRRCANTCAP